VSPEQFKIIREKLGLTQVELARILGLSGGKPISHFETGFRTPSSLIAGLMSFLNSQTDRRALDLIEQLREHVEKVQRTKKRKANV
jgi:DNA-binding transcriptional regulator YiaG